MLALFSRRLVPMARVRWMRQVPHTVQFPVHFPAPAHRAPLVRSLRRVHTRPHSLSIHDDRVALAVDVLMRKNSRMDPAADVMKVDISRVCEDLKVAGVDPTGLDVFEALVYGCCSHEDVSAVDWLFGLLKSTGKLPSAAVFHSVHWMHLRRGDVWAVRDVQEQMAASGVVPTQAGFGQLINRCQELDDVACALDTMTAMRGHGLSPDLYNYNTVLGMLCGRSQGDKAWELFECMKADGAYPDASTFNTFLSMYVQQENFEQVDHVLRLMEEEEVSPDVVTFNNRIRVACCRRGLDEALRVVHEEMPCAGVEPDVATYTAILAHACSVVDGDGARRIMDEMVSAGVAPDARSYSYLIQMHCGLDETEEAERVVQEMHEAGVFPGVVTGTMLIQMYCRLERVEDAFRILRSFRKQGVKPTLVTCNILLGACYQQCEWTLVEEVYALMDALGLEPDHVTYTVVLSALLQNQDVERARSVVSEMVARQIAMDAQAVTVVVDVYCRNDEFVEALNLLERFLAQTETVPDEEEENTAALDDAAFRIILRRLASVTGSVDDVTLLKTTLSLLERAQLTPTAEICSDALVVVNRSGDTEMLQEQLSNFRPHIASQMDYRLGKLVVSLYIRCGWLDDALEALNMFTNRAGAQDDVKSVAPYEELVKAAVSVDKLDIVEAALVLADQARLTPTADMVNIAMEKFHPLGNGELKEPAHGRVPRGEAYAALIRGLGEHRRMSEAWTAIKRTLAAGKSVSSETLGTLKPLFLHYAQKSSMSEAVILWRLMLETEDGPGPEAFRTMTTLVGKFGSSAQVFALFEDMKKWSCNDLPQLVAPLICEMVASGKVETAVKVIEKMDRSTGCPRANALCLNPILEAYCARRQVKAVRVLWERVVGCEGGPNEDSLRIMIDFNCSMGKLEQAEVLSQDILKRGDALPRSVVVSLMDLMCRKGELFRAQQQLEEALRSGHSLDVDLLNPLLFFYTDGRSRIPITILGAEEVWKQILQTPSGPNHLSFAAMISMYLRLGRDSDAEASYEEMKSRGVPPTPKIEYALEQARKNQADLLKALKLILEDRRLPSVSVVERLLSWLARRGRVEEAWKVVAIAESSGLRLKPKQVRPILGHVRCLPQIKWLDQAWRRLTRTHSGPTESEYLIFLRAWTKMRMKDRVVGLRRDMRSRGVRASPTVAHLLKVAEAKLGLHKAKPKRMAK